MSFNKPPKEHLSPNNHRPLKNQHLSEHHPLLYKISQLMDSRFKIFGITFGLDFLLGLIPFFGNIATTFVSLFTVAYSAFHGVSWIVLLRMLLNISVDMLLTAIPLFGNISDIFWRANVKNYRLLDDYTQHPSRTIKRSAVASFLILATYLGLLGLLLYGIYKVIVYLISLF